MGQLIYEDTRRKYFLLDYSPSHSELVIRAFIDKDKNVDLFFKNVQTINLTPKFNGIKITTDSKKTDNNFTFKISDNDGNTGFIQAGLFVEFNNGLDMLQTSLGDFTWTNENKEISSFPIK
jgi:hypothetical protein